MTGIYKGDGVAQPGAVSWLQARKDLLEVPPVFAPPDLTCLFVPPALEQDHDLRNQERDVGFGAQADPAASQPDLRVPSESPFPLPHIGKKKVDKGAVAMGMRLKTRQFQPHPRGPGFQSAFVGR